MHVSIVSGAKSSQGQLGSRNDSGVQRKEQLFTVRGTRMEPSNSTHLSVTLGKSKVKCIKMYPHL